jgi:hypothetical protein
MLGLNMGSIGPPYRPACCRHDWLGRMREELERTAAFVLCRCIRAGPQMRLGATDSSMAVNVGFSPPVASTDDNSGPLTLWEISIDESTPTIF